MTQLIIEKEEQAEKSGTPPRGRRICFVCTGNTCRSPMAQAVANTLAKERQAEENAAFPLTIACSRGLWANENEPISPLAVEALEEAGVAATSPDYHAHTAHNLTGEEAERFDLLIGMTASHCMQLTMRFPALAPRIVCMPREIPDPFGGDLEDYRACLQEIRKGVEVLLFSGDAE